MGGAKCEASLAVEAPDEACEWRLVLRAVFDGARGFDAAVALPRHRRGQGGATRAAELAPAPGVACMGRLSERRRRRNRIPCGALHSPQTRGPPGRKDERVRAQSAGREPGRRPKRHASPARGGRPMGTRPTRAAVATPADGGTPRLGAELGGAHLSSLVFARHRAERRQELHLQRFALASKQGQAQHGSYARLVRGRR